MGSLNRKEGWEARLVHVLEEARHRPYVLGEHDCFRLAGKVIEALTGVDPTTPFIYRSKRQALALIARHGEDFTEAMSWLFGSEPVSWQWLRRGDIAEYVDREPHLAIVVGDHAAVLGERGLIFVPLAQCRHGWRIG